MANTTPLAALYCTNEPSSAVAITPEMPLAASPTSCSAWVLNTNSAPFSVAELYSISPRFHTVLKPSGRGSLSGSPSLMNDTASGFTCHFSGRVSQPYLAVAESAFTMCRPLLSQSS